MSDYGSVPSLKRLMESPRAGAPLETHVERPEGMGAEALLDFWDIFRRRKWLILGLTFTGFLLGVAWSIPQPIVYSSAATLEVQPINENFMGSAQVDPLAGGYSPSEVNLSTQIAKITSKTVRNAAIQRLWRETVPMIPPEPPGAFYSLRRASLKLVRRSVPQDPVVATTQALVMANSSVKVHLVKGTRIIEISCESTDPGIAASFANTLAEEFIEQSLTARLKSVKRAGEWLSQQAADLKSKVDNSEKEVQGFVAGPMRGSEALAGRDLVAQSQLQQIDRDLFTLQTNWSNIKNLVETATRATPEEIALTPEGAAMRPSVMRLAELKKQLTEASVKLTPAHPRIQELQAQISETQENIDLARQVMTSRLTRDTNQAKDRLDRMQAFRDREAAKLGVGPDVLAQYNALKGQAITNRQLYLSVLENLNLAGLVTAAPTNNLKIVDPAQADIKPDQLRSWILNACLGVVTGLLVAIGLSTLLHRLHQRLKFPGDATTLLRLPELGVIPSNDMEAAQHWWGRLKIRGASPQPLFGKIELATSAAAGPSWLAESFRNTLASIVDPNGQFAGGVLISITSPGPREGKSTIASNLAIALTQTDRRVLVIDADFRAPRLHQVFGCKNTWGMKDIITEQTPIEDYPLDLLGQPTQVPRLFLLPGGAKEVSLTEVFYSKRLRDLLERLRREFDHIIIDTPPVLAFADARLLGHLTDGTILVLRAEVTQMSAAIAARNRLLEDGVVVLGTILNDCSQRGIGYDYSSHYGYYAPQGKGKGGREHASIAVKATSSSDDSIRN